MVDDLAASFFADPDSGFLVRPKMVNRDCSGDARSASTTAPPCDPVAPVTRMTFGSDMVSWNRKFAGDQRGVEMYGDGFDEKFSEGRASDLIHS